MATGLTTFLKKNLLWILLFGTLIGLNEALIGSLSFPYRSVVLSAITIVLLSFARLKIPQIGTSTLVICIAILFKLNNFGFHSCTANVLLCGPTALLMLGLSFELFASLLIKKSEIKYLNYSLACGLTALFAFSLFGLMSTYIIGSWHPDRLVEYIFIKGSMTAIASIIICIIGIVTTNILKNRNFTRLNPYLISSILGIMVVALWLFGSLTKF